MKRRRAADFIASSRSRKKRRERQQHPRSNGDGEQRISQLLGEVRDAVRKDSNSELELGSDLEMLKEAIEEADDANENEGSVDDDLSSDSESDETTIANASKNTSVPKADSKKPKSNGRKSKGKPSLKPADESDDDGATVSHQAELEALKHSDPEFYKYLQDNDAGLLDFEDNDVEAVSDDKLKRASNENEDSNDSADESPAEKDADSRHDDEMVSEDDDEEALAAAEAGLEIDPDSEAEDEDELDEGSASEKPSSKANGKKPSVEEGKSKLIDMGYLRTLQTQLAHRRTSLKACKELLRIFRAGRELAVSSDVVNKSKKNALKAKKRRSRKQGKDKDEDEIDEEDDDSDDEFVDDRSYVAGDVRFVSAKAYQKAMNMAIIGIQGTLDSLLGKPRVKSENDKSGIAALASWSPKEHPRWSNLQPTFRSFVVHMFSLTEHMKDARTLRFLLKRLESMVPYTKEKPGLTRKLIRIALSLWSAQSRNMSHATKLRAFLLLHAVASEEENTDIVLRKVCQVYSKTIAAVCNPRTLPSISFATKCIVELFGIDMGASYTVAFTHLRQIAVTLRTVLTSREINTDMEKIYNWTTINNIRLWSRVLARYGAEDELEPLIYPFVQISLGILRLQASPKNFPLRLHVCNFVTDLANETGVFIPMAPHLLSMLRCAELKRSPKPGATRVLEWRSLLRVADDVVPTKPYLGGIIRGIVLQFAKYFAGMSKHVSFPEISHRVSSELRKFAKTLKVPDWKRDIIDLCDQLMKTAKLIMDMRAKADFGPSGAIGPLGMREIVPGLTEEMKTPIQRLYEMELKRKEREESLRDEASVENDNKKARDMDDTHADNADGMEEDASGDDDDKNQAPKSSKPVKKQSKSSFALVASDEEPDEVAEFQLSDSEGE